MVFLKNRGVLVGGESIEEAFHLLRRVMNAIDVQVNDDVLHLMEFCVSSSLCSMQDQGFRICLR